MAGLSTRTQGAGDPMSIPIRCVILRGGTSKGIYLREADLPQMKGTVHVP